MAPATVDIEQIRAAALRIAGQVERTPLQRSETLSRRLGCELFIKFENQQFTASFKERGALNRLLVREAEGGVIAMSAGNHAQALAYHGSRMGVPTTIVMPRSTPNAKVEATRVFGAEVILHGSTFDETRQFTETTSAERGLELIHPFDDPWIIAGQGTVGLEMCEQFADLDVVVVPTGGGGLLGGVACAVKSLYPRVQVVGVQMERYAGAYRQFNDHHGNVSADTDAAAQARTGQSTVAEGIAVKSPGDLNQALLHQYVDKMAVVGESAVEQAIFDLLEIEKTVAEGAGAAPLAHIGAQRDHYRGQKVGMVLSGGNIDMMILSSVLQRGLVRSHRLVRLQVEISDTPGGLARLTSLLDERDSNIMDISHQRAFGGSSVRATLVELVLQLRGEEQQDTIAQALKEQGYDMTFVD